jgi:hypothetical protein
VSLSNHDDLELDLNLAGAKGTDINLPDNMDAYLLRGIEQGKTERRSSKTRIRRRVLSSAAACLILLTGFFTIRNSPVFASIIRDIPGMEGLVNLIQKSSDKGIQLALQNDFIQPIGVSDEHESVKLTVEGIVVDEARLVLFYAIESLNPDRVYNLNSARLMDVSGKDLEVGVGWGNSGRDESEPRGMHRGTIDVLLTDGVTLPSELVLKAELKPLNVDGFNTSVDMNATEPPIIVEDPSIIRGYKIAIPIDHAKFAGMKEEYILNQTITAEDQRITFVKATVNPTRIAVEVQADPRNSKQVFSAGDIRLVDEKGEVWKSFGSSGMIHDKAVLYFESSYFHKPKKLYVEGSWFRALDKDKMDVVIDTERGLLIKAPDSALKLKSISPYGKSYTKLTLSIAVNREIDDMMGYSVLDNKFKDASGKEFDMANIGSGVISGSSGLFGANVQESYQYLDNKAYKQPLTFHVWLYPNYIREPYRIRVK